MLFRFFARFYLVIALGWVPALAQTQTERGELLFDIGGCTNCHTSKDGPLLAGGEPIVSPFGTFYAPNITPDSETGIGGWSNEEFIQAMRFGISPEGEPYYPAFPFTSYTKMSDDDLRALKAYLDSIPPVQAENPAHQLRMPIWPYLEIPIDPRFTLWGWRWLFFEPKEWVESDAHDAAWNRGAYLVEGPGHCSECHTPRNMFGALDDSQYFRGNPDGAEGEKVPDITPTENGIGEWSSADVTLFLQMGMLPDGDFAGSNMAKIIENGTSKLSNEDRAAMAAYLMSLPER